MVAFHIVKLHKKPYTGVKSYMLYYSCSQNLQIIYFCLFLWVYLQRNFSYRSLNYSPIGVPPMCNTSCFDIGFRLTCAVVSFTIKLRLYQFLMAVVYLHTDFIYRKVDSLRFDALTRSTVVFHVPQPWGNLNCLILPFTVIRHIRGRLPLGFVLAFCWLCLI